jgi:UDP:flavonoid glycosyltransferase YjiC (YdhE family)
MHYGIIAIGSRGDVQPYIALALGLQERGHSTTVMAHENFQGFVEGYGVAFHRLEGNVEDMLHSEEALKVLRSGRILAFAKYLQKNIRKTREAVSQDLYKGCLKADVLVASLLAMPWVDSIAEKTGKRWAIVQLNLPATSTTAFPLAAMDYFNFPLYNRFTYKLFEFFYWQSNKKGINDFRKSIRLPELKTPILKKIADQKILNLHCFSPSLRARPHDWPSQIDITGFLFLPNEKRRANFQEQIPVDLIRWLNTGEKPIYIGFGSIPIPDPKKFESILTELLDTTTHRFIFCQGWSLPTNLPDHPRLFKVKSISHDWLLPRCKAAIIHGGVGTTAAALKAKIPLIIVSIIADQPWWGKIIEAKLTGVHIPFKKLTKQKLQFAIKKTETPEMRRQAVRLGERINLEDGLSKTVDALERYFL